MMQKRIAILLLAFLLAGCSEKKPVETTDPQSQTTEATVPPIKEMDSLSTELVLNLRGDTMVTTDGRVIRGRDASTNDPRSESERFADAEKENGTFDENSLLILRFADQVPVLIDWYTRDGFGQSNQGSIACDGQAQIEIPLGNNLGSALGSNLDKLPSRRISLVCRYPDRSVEYLLVMKKDVEWIEP